MKKAFKKAGIILIFLSVILIYSCKKHNSTPPIITTDDVTAITQTTAISGGNITSDGGDSVTVRGVCWSTNPNPVFNDDHTSDGSSIGSFVSNVSGLTPTTTYYIRAYATNSAGTSYGKELTFITPATDLSVTDIDLNVYNTVTIGTQIWMAENLKTTKYNDNTEIPLITDNNAWAALTSPGYSWYHNNEASYKTSFGALYNWYTADFSSNGGKNVCPLGWHVPSVAEWTTLTTFLGGANVAGGKLKETGSTIWTSPNMGANNETGFSALPGGSRDLYGLFSGIGTYGIWWSVTETDSNYASRIYLDSNDGSAESDNGFKKGGFSIRCLKD
jgi:uncharacterized protein (TIGR02145 family)